MHSQWELDQNVICRFGVVKLLIVQAFYEKKEVSSEQIEIQFVFLFSFQGHVFYDRKIQFFQGCVTSKMIFQMLIQAPSLTLTLHFVKTFEKQTFAKNSKWLPFLKIAAIKSMIPITLDQQVGFE